VPMAERKRRSKGEEPLAAPPTNPVRLLLDAGINTFIPGAAGEGRAASPTPTKAKKKRFVLRGWGPYPTLLPYATRPSFEDGDADANEDEEFETDSETENIKKGLIIRTHHKQVRNLSVLLLKKCMTGLPKLSFLTSETLDELDAGMTHFQAKLRGIWTKLDKGQRAGLGGINRNTKELFQDRLKEMLVAILAKDDAKAELPFDPAAGRTFGNLQRSINIRWQTVLRKEKATSTKIINLFTELKARAKQDAEVAKLDCRKIIGKKMMKKALSEISESEAKAAAAAIKAKRRAGVVPEAVEDEPDDGGDDSPVEDLFGDAFPAPKDMTPRAWSSSKPRRRKPQLALMDCRLAEDATPSPSHGPRGKKRTFDPAVMEKSLFDADVSPGSPAASRQRLRRRRFALPASPAGTASDVTRGAATAVVAVTPKLADGLPLIWYRVGLRATDDIEKFPLFLAEAGIDDDSDLAALVKSGWRPKTLQTFQALSPMGQLKVKQYFASKYFQNLMNAIGEVPAVDSDPELDTQNLSRLSSLRNLSPRPDLSGVGAGSSVAGGGNGASEASVPWSRLAAELQDLEATQRVRKGRGGEQSITPTRRPPG